MNHDFDSKKNTLVRYSMASPCSFTRTSFLAFDSYYLSWLQPIIVCEADLEILMLFVC